MRIYASDVPVENLMADDPEAMTTRHPVVMEVEPDQHITDPRWLADRVDHIRRHDPARVLAECAAKRRIVEEFAKHDQRNSLNEQAWQAWHLIVLTLARVYADHPDFDLTWNA